MCWTPKKSEKFHIPISYPSGARAGLEKLLEHVSEVQSFKTFHFAMLEKIINWEHQTVLLVFFVVKFYCKCDEWVRIKTRHQGGQGKNKKVFIKA